MHAGSVPTSKLNNAPLTEGIVLPIGLRIYRFGLVTGGLAWIFIASTLCGCGNMNGWVMNQSGRGYYNRGNYATAQMEFERALLDDPYNPTYAYNVAKAMEKQGDVAAAEQMYQHAMTLDPGHQPAYRGMSNMLVAQGRPDEARQLLTAWTQTQPYSAASHVEMAQLERESGNFTAAEQQLNAALQIRPRSRQALNERTRLYQATGRSVRGGPYSELALASRTAPAAMPASEGMIASTPQQSGALHMAQTMSQKDPTMTGGVMQASYTPPQMTGLSGSMSPMMMNAPPQFQQAQVQPSQVHQTQMIPVPEGQSGWMPVQSQAEMGMSMQMMSPEPTLNQPGQMQPTQMLSPQMQPTQQMPLNQPIELGQPVPITQAYPGYGVPADEFSLNQAQVAPPTMIGGVPSVQAF